MSDAITDSESGVMLRANARRSRLRFSLRGIFVFTLGLAVALAYRRVPNVGWVDTVLAACASWISVGVLQETRETWLFWRANHEQPRDVQWGFALELARQLAAVLLMAAGGAFLLIRQTRIENPSHDFMFDWALANLAWTIFFFGVVLSYWPKSEAQQMYRDRRASPWPGVLDWTAAGLGFYWLLHILTGQMAVVGLVHIAIRGVESYEPLPWLNEPFYPANFHAELARQFTVRSILAALLIAVAFGSTLLVNRFWNARATRIVALLVAVLSSSGAAWLAWWAWAVAYPVLSPFLAPQTFIQPSINWIAGLTLIMGASLALVCRLVPRPVAANESEWPSRQRNTLQYSTPVMALLLMATFCASLQIQSAAALLRYRFGLQRLWDFASGVLDAGVSDPRMAMHFAAILVVGWHVWRRRRRVADRPEPLVAVNPVQLVTVGLLAFSSLIVLVPVAAWLGFVLVVYAPLIGLQ
jgi:hypothetical protein